MNTYSSFVAKQMLDRYASLHAGTQTGCAAVAWDRQDGDICGNIQIQPSASCVATQNVACTTCPIAQLQQGLCIPDT